LLWRRRDGPGITEFGGRSPLNYIPIGPSGYDIVPNYRQSLADVARLLLDRGADVNARNNLGRAPLHTTTNMGLIEVVRVLLDRGADVAVEDRQGRTPFALAKEDGDEEMIKLLSEHGTTLQRLSILSISTLTIL
jgi:ankyrin repeat protein